LRRSAAHATPEGALALDLLDDAPDLLALVGDVAR
jgi:hypothetical protein